MDLSSISKMILLGLLPVEFIANKLNLSHLDREDFINQTTVLVNQCAKDSALLDNLSEELIVRVSALSANPDRAIDALAKQDDSGDFVAHDSGEYIPQVDPLGVGSPLSLPTVPIDFPVSDSVQFAYSLICFLRDPDKRKSHEALLLTSTKMLSNAHSILDNTLMSAVSAAAGTGVAVGINVAISLIKEYQYQSSKTGRKAKLEDTISQAERQYLLLHKMYDDVSKYYQRALDVTDKTHGKNSPEYLKKMEEWLGAERYFQEQVNEQQRHIAAISSLHQQEQSQRRMARVNDGVSTVLSMTSLAGPPGMIAAAALKSLTRLGTMVGQSVIQDSARFNHGLSSESRVLLITDESSLETAHMQLHASVHPAVALSGPIIGMREVLGVNIDRAIYTVSALADRLISNLDRRRSCSFAFSKPIPDIPIVQPAPAEQDYMTSPDLKKAGKAQLQALVEAQKTLIEQQRFIEALSSRIMKTPPWPHVLNYNELIQSLSDAHLEIKKQRELLRQQMGNEYRQNPNAEGMKLLSELDMLEKRYELNLLQLKKISKELEKTPHRTLYNSNHEEAITAYAADDEACRMLLKDIEFNITVLNQIIEKAEHMGKGRHISNMGQAIRELQGQLRVLESAAKINPKLNYATAITACRDKIDKLIHKSAYLDKLRIEFVVREERDRSDSARYQELSALRAGLFDYGDDLPDLTLDLPPGTAGSTGMSIFHQIDMIQRQMLTTLHEGLSHATPIDPSTLAETDAIVTPNRMFFGLTKHEDMQRSVDEKVETLLEEDPLMTCVQVMPLRVVDEEMMAACLGRADHLKSMIEGLKTELQWINRFQETCALRRITIANTTNLVACYTKQIETLTAACAQREKAVGSIPGSNEALSRAKAMEIKARLHNAVSERSLMAELTKAQEALTRIKNYSTMGILAMPDSEPDLDLDADLVFAPALDSNPSTDADSDLDELLGSSSTDSFVKMKTRFQQLHHPLDDLLDEAPAPSAAPKH